MAEKTCTFTLSITKISQSSQFLHAAHSFFTLSDEDTKTRNQPFLLLAYKNIYNLIS